MKKSFMTIGIVLTLLLATLPLSAACSSNVCRHLPSGELKAGSEITVSLDVKADCATYYCIDETVPKGWIVTSASDGGDYKSDQGHIKWLTLEGATDKTYIYTVKIPESAKGSYSFDGIYQIEGMNKSTTIGCDKEVCITDGVPPIGTSSVCRYLPDGTQAAGSSIAVSLCVTPGLATYYAIEEIVPKGWIVTSASDEGDYKSDPGHIKWLTLEGATDKTYTYTVKIPESAKGSYSFNGIYQIEGMNKSTAIGCNKQIFIGEALDGICLSEGWNFVSIPYVLENQSFEDITEGLPLECIMEYNSKE
ncbi:MAG: hypothetical protein PHU28_05975, partial [Methanosarcinaceae archaeon]|nr:hypothetical protein [Methanosarcinaceae archaeon]